MEDAHGPVSVNPFRGTQYRAIRRLGAGGMGEVYEVEHEVVGRLLVAKILRANFAGDGAIADRMRVEAQALAALCHPNIVDVIDFARTADGRPFYVMERLEGRTLGEELRRRGVFPVDEAIDVVRQILAGLAAAHDLGLVHRDVKLDNVFLHRTASGERVVKLLDFGVAKVLSARTGRGPAPPALPTTEGAIVGTPRYVSPEQVLGKGVDHRADIYAAGLVLYTLVCGRGPFDHVRKQEDFFTAHLGDDPPAPSDVAPQPLPHELDAAILRALRKNPDARFQSAAEFSAALERIAARRCAPVAYLETTPSNALEATGTRPDGAAPGGALGPSGERPDGAAAGEALVPSPREQPATAPPRPLSTRTEVIPPGQLDVSNGSALPTRTAGVLLPTRTAEAMAVAPRESEAPTVPAHPHLAYAAAAVVALSIAALGAWLVDAHSVLALAAVLVASVAGATLAARIVSALMR